MNMSPHEERQLCDVAETYFFYTYALTIFLHGPVTDGAPGDDVALEHARAAAELLNLTLARLSVRYTVPIVRNKSEAGDAIARCKFPVIRKALARSLGTQAEEIFVTAFGFASALALHGSVAQKDSYADALEAARAAAVPRQILDDCISDGKLDPLKVFLTGEASRKVFLVHGRDHSALQDMDRFVSDLGLTPVILREQPNRGKSIIEKFLDYADVKFAIVLLTADDEGRLRAAPERELLPRARQNVLLELGFFIGRLGRESVCVLCGEGVDVPSDYGGVGFISFDHQGSWKTELTRELAAAGLLVRESIAGSA